MARKHFSLNIGWRYFHIRMARFIGIVAALWILFFFADSALPYIRPGAEVVYAAKSEVIQTGALFRPDAHVKLVIVGNSQVLTGFKPELFDSLSGATVSSYNIGLPDFLMFAGNLENLCRRGETPTHVLLMFPWADGEESSFSLFHPGIDDNRVISQLFPFRKLPRNLLLFAARSRSRGGLRAYYADCRRQSQVMLDQKGYYFIEGQSHYPEHRLPDDFRLQRDDPSQPFVRSVSTNSLEFRRLSAIVEKYGVKVIFVPRYFREGEIGPAAPVSAITANLSSHPQISVQGPDCWLLPNRYFSDPTHLNPEGAEHYTRRLWALLEPVLKKEAVAPQ